MVTIHQSRRTSVQNLNAICIYTFSYTVHTIYIFLCVCTRRKPASSILKQRRCHVYNFCNQISIFGYQIIYLNQLFGHVCVPFQIIVVYDNLIQHLNHFWSNILKINKKIVRTQI